MPQLRSRLPSPLGPRRAGASRQRAPDPPGRVYKPPRPPASERASERARRELCPRGKGSAPCSGRIPTLCVSLAAQTQRARHGGESGSQGPPARPPARLPLARGEAAPPPASQPASQPASVFSLRVCVPRKRPPDWASPELSSRAETCVWMWCGGPSFRASLDGWGRKDRVSFHAGRRSSRSAPGRARERGAPAERPPLCPGGASPSRSRLLAFAPGREGGKEGRKEGAGWLRECGSVGDVTGSLTGLSSALACLPLGPRSIRERHDFISDT